MDPGGSHADPVVRDARRKFSAALESNVLDYLHYGEETLQTPPALGPNPAAHAQQFHCYTAYLGPTAPRNLWLGGGALRGWRERTRKLARRPRRML
jgi:hypothetical protein